MSNVSREGLNRRNTRFENELLTVAEVADYLRVSRVTIWRWCQQGIIPASQIGRNWRIRRDDLLQLLESFPPSENSQLISYNQ
jgi:excisionase family DNA binding protein